MAKKRRTGDDCPPSTKGQSESQTSAEGSVCKVSCYIWPWLDRGRLDVRSLQRQNSPLLRWAPKKVPRRGPWQPLLQLKRPLDWSHMQTNTAHIHLKHGRGLLAKQKDPLQGWCETNSLTTKVAPRQNQKGSRKWRGRRPPYRWL